jgi:hypothetical protein
MCSNNRIRIAIVALVAAVAGMITGGSALARTAFDGDWSVLISTSNGPCSSSYRYGVQIADGAVIYGGGMVNMQGKVTPKGAVRVMVQSGGQWANGHGHLTRTRGGGVWTGQGAGGTCSGSWIAERL